MSMISIRCLWSILIFFVQLYFLTLLLYKIPNKNVQHIERYHATILYFDLKESCVDWWYTKYSYHFICQNPPLIYDIVAKWLVVMCCIEIMLKKIRRAFKEKNAICLECQHPFRRYGGITFFWFWKVDKGGRWRGIKAKHSRDSLRTHKGMVTENLPLRLFNPRFDC